MKYYETRSNARKKIVSSIATMDRRMLAVLLPDNGVYDDIYKDVIFSLLGNEIITVTK